MEVGSGAECVLRLTLAVVQNQAVGGGDHYGTGGIGESGILTRCSTEYLFHQALLVAKEVVQVALDS